MPTTEFDPWRDSQRRSRSRRSQAARRLRMLRGRRSLVAVLIASLSLAAGAAAAAGPGSGAKVVRSSGSTVAELQKALGIPADGIYGPQTRRAVRRFQRANGLVVDGIAGPQTLAALGLTARGASRRGTDAASVLARIAECESGGDPTAVSRDRRYFGKYQFSRPTWRSVGGRGNPARASEAEQDRRALTLYEREGTAPWPVCGRS
ncbi:MAG TPA: transglycosylase family protein [Solirubrobacteraceae bacterium]|nr:transglycosylase family protein [Solirubrobacteraceae bacterium]